jgi:ABC-type phosphate transport system substrate-binding protein
MKFKRNITLFSICLLLTAGIANAGVAVVANPANGESKLSAKDIKRLFLGKKSTFPGGSRAIVIDQAEGSATRNYFYKKIVKKKPAQLKAYWSKKIFSGKGAPPPSLANDNEVKSWVNQNPEGLGYIDSSAVDGSVKVLLSLD